MWYNHAKAELIFQKEWKEKERFYRDNGMTDAQIDELYDLERDIFKSDRRFYEHCDPDHKKLAQIHQEAVTETYSSTNWIAVLPIEIQQQLLLLPAEHLQAFYYYRVLRLSQRDVAGILHNSQQTVSRWICEIAEIIKSMSSCE